MQNQLIDDSPQATTSSGVTVEELEIKIKELTSANIILKANISTLYRTARAEIARKNERISELQSELDDLLFKRMRTNQKKQVQSASTSSQ